MDKLSHEFMLALHYSDEDKTQLRSVWGTLDMVKSEMLAIVEREWQYMIKNDPSSLWGRTEKVEDIQVTVDKESGAEELYAVASFDTYTLNVTAKRVTGHEILKEVE